MKSRIKIKTLFRNMFSRRELPLRRANIMQNYLMLYSPLVNYFQLGYLFLSVTSVRDTFRGVPKLA